MLISILCILDFSAMFHTMYYIRIQGPVKQKTSLCMDRSITGLINLPLDNLFASRNQDIFPRPSESPLSYCKTPEEKLFWRDKRLYKGLQ